MTIDEQIEQVKLHLEWLEAKRDGKPFDVQILTIDGVWIDDKNPVWSSVVRYRRKPREPREPRRCWVRYCGDKPLATYRTEPGCDGGVYEYGGEVVEMVEVIKEDKK